MNVWLPGELLHGRSGATRSSHCSRSERRGEKPSQRSSFRPVSLRYQSPVLRIASIGNVVGCLTQGRRRLVVLNDLVVEVLQRTTGHCSLHSTAVSIEAAWRFDDSQSEAVRTVRDGGTRRRVEALLDGWAARGSDRGQARYVPTIQIGKTRRNSGETVTIHAASRINQLRKSSSAASHFSSEISPLSLAAERASRHVALLLPFPCLAPAGRAHPTGRLQPTDMRARGARTA